MVFVVFDPIIKHGFCLLNFAYERVLCRGKHEPSIGRVFVISWLINSFVISDLHS